MNDQEITKTIDLYKTIEKTIAEIMDYESYTFSASDSQVTRAEAIGMLDGLIGTRISIGFNIDGCELSSQLDGIRDLHSH